MKCSKVPPCPLRRRQHWKEVGDERCVQGGKGVSGDLAKKIADRSQFHLPHHNSDHLHRDPHKYCIIIIIRPTLNREEEPCVQITPSAPS